MFDYPASLLVLYHFVQMPCRSGWGKGTGEEGRCGGERGEMEMAEERAKS